MPGEPGGVGEQQGEPLHPAVDRHVVDLDPAFGEQLLDEPADDPDRDGVRAWAGRRPRTAVTTNDLPWRRPVMARW
jgi:hypothetical protein